MVRLRYAAIAALLLTVGWLVWLGYAADWRDAEFYEALGEAALSWRLMGLAAVCYTQAATAHRTYLRYALAVGDEAAEKPARDEVVRARMTVARILLAAERPHAALHFAEEAYRADFASVEAAALMWRIRYATGMTSEARRELLLLGIRETVPELLTPLAELFLIEGRTEQAHEFATRALAKHSRHAEAWLVLAHVLAVDDQRHEARRAAEKAMESAERQPVIRLQAARLHRQLHQDAIQWQIGGRGLDYWAHVAVAWVQEHVAFVAGLAGYLLFLFSPAIAAAMGYRRPIRPQPTPAAEDADDAPGDL